MRISPVAVALVPLCLTAACGGANLFSPSGSGGSKSGGKADLSQVPEPSSLILTGHIGKPSVTLQSAHAMSQFPMPDAERVAELLTTETVSALVDLDQPIDFAAVAAGEEEGAEPLVAVSVAIKDVEKAKEALSEHYKFTPWENGAVKIEGIGKSELERDKYAEERDEDDRASAQEGGDREHACVMAPAFGAAPMRLVCAMNVKALSALVPYLTRTSTRASYPSDLHAEIRLSPLKATLEKKRAAVGALVGSGMSSGFASSMRELVNVLIGESVNSALDLDVLALDADVKADVATASMTFKFGGATSLWTRLAISHPERTDVPPAAFWQLPSDASFAAFHRGLDQKDFDVVREVMTSAIGAAFEREGIPEADRRAVTEAVGKLPSGAPAVFAFGLDEQALQKAVAQQKAVRTGDVTERTEAKRGVVEALGGWEIVGIQEPQKKFADAAKELEKAWARPTIAKVYRAKSKDAPVPTVKVVALPKTSTLPKETVHLEATLPLEPEPDAPMGAPQPKTGKDGKKEVKKEAAKPKKLTPPKPISLHMFFVPDGDHTWIGVGADETLVTNKVMGVMATGQDATKLSSRAGLEKMKDARVGAGGFLSYAYFRRPDSAEAMFRGKTSGAERFDQLLRSPSHGATPVPFAMTAQPGLQATATVTLPKAALQDILRGVVQGL